VRWDGRSADLSLLDELVGYLLVLCRRPGWVFPEEVGLTAEHVSFGIVPRR